MELAVRDLVKKLGAKQFRHASVIKWGAPVPVFGDVSKACIATLGLNPSNKEFVDAYGTQLDGSQRRFHTLQSLGIQSWSDAKQKHIRLISESCLEYFHKNPYRPWFDQLDQIVSATGYSYYDREKHACHLDLVPFATAEKWALIQRGQKDLLLSEGAMTLASMLRTSRVSVIVANGRGVVDGLQRASGVLFDATPIEAWSLARASGKDVQGIAFKGVVHELSGVPIGRGINVLGFSHNIQSSYGVRKDVRHAIAKWVKDNTRRMPI